MLLVKYASYIVAGCLFVMAAVVVVMEIAAARRESRPMSIRWRRAMRLGTFALLAALG
jgi:hypothetical protein